MKRKILEGTTKETLLDAISQRRLEITSDEIITYYESNIIDKVAKYPEFLELNITEILDLVFEKQNITGWLARINKNGLEISLFLDTVDINGFVIKQCLYFTFLNVGTTLLDLCYGFYSNDTDSNIVITTKNEHYEVKLKGRGYRQDDTLISVSNFLAIDFNHTFDTFISKYKNVKVLMSNIPELFGKNLISSQIRKERFYLEYAKIEPNIYTKINKLYFMRLESEEYLKTNELEFIKVLFLYNTIWEFYNPCRIKSETIHGLRILNGLDIKRSNRKKQMESEIV